MSDDDDWFERALREDEPDEGGDAERTPDEGGDAERTPDEGADAERTPDEGGDAERTPDESDTPDGDGAETDGELPDESTASEPVETESTGTDEVPEGPDADPFDEDFASALEDAPEPEGDPFGGDSFGDSLDEDFGGDSFGDSLDEGFDFGGEGGGTTDFDDEDFESNIERLDVGIEGLDEMILGGVPTRSLIAAIGSAGTGKTTLGLQFLYEALRNDERAVFITLEESRQRIIDTADEKGWNFSDYVADDQLAIIDLDPIEMANSLSSIRDDLPRLVDAFDATRLVLDSVSLLEMMYDRPSRRRSEVFEFTRSLKQAGVTTLVTSEASEESAYTSRYGIVEYLADAVFVLQYVRPSDFRETRLAIEIQKIRDANHSRETKPYELTGDGISVYRQANIF